MTANPKLAPLRDKVYRKAHRDMRCIIGGGGCEGDVMLCHYRGSWLGLSIKPPDNHSMPMCWSHHSMQHSMDERMFWREAFRDNPVLLDEIMKMAGCYRYDRWRTT